MSTNSSPTLASPSTRSAKLDRLRLTARKAATPPPRLSLPEWADEFRHLAPEAGSTSGKWRTSTVEIGRGPMMAVTEPGVETLSGMVSTQLLKTALLENIFGYFAHLDPCPILLVQPKDDAAEAFSKERIAPMIRVTPALKGLVGHRHTRTSEDTLTFKSFPGGFLALVGAGSPDNLARRPIRLTLYDEVDKYPVTKEGDPFVLGDERQATFSNALSVRVCSPTISGASRIETSHNEGDQRKPSVECPHCSHRQFLTWKHVQWEKRVVEGHDTEHLHQTAQIYCEACGTGWNEGERLKALQTIRWHQTRPFICCGERQVPLEAYAALSKAGVADPVAPLWDWWSSRRWAVYRAKCRCCGEWAVSNHHASFNAGKLYSPWSRKDSPARIAKKWLDAQGDEDKLQAWWNTQMGLPYRRHAGKEIPAETLAARRENWKQGHVPQGAVILTAGIDTQDDRVEVEVVGWGRDEESWSIDYEIIPGAFDDPNTKKKLDEYLLRTFRRADGREMRVVAGCQDSGGHHTDAVYEFSKGRLGRQVWAIKGASDRAGKRSPVWPSKKPTKRKRDRFRPFIIGTQTAKDVISHRLQIAEPGPGYMHYPADRDFDWFNQITAERLTVKVEAGQRYFIWQPIPGRANEGLDCRVYAYAALKGLMAGGLKLNNLAERIGGDDPAEDPPPGPAAEPEASEQETTPTPAPKPRRSRRRRQSRSGDDMVW
ncbi:MAG: terminase [Brevundimonas sp.]|uniref:phage terminase large subunit family protein n=1 Tax=Brevundimonas sp. TaxID=1871086 RepID=UPI000DB5D2AA|nr:terminase gpA endonuclease subunit [Brevundimonas sp.]PZU71663.1 MAG: terminase [Brevundimonas sp.]